MHSIIAVGALGSIVYMILPVLLVPFAVAMMSHIIVDMFNFKKVYVLYPVKKGIALNLCKSDGAINKLLFVSGIAVSIILVLISLINF